MLAATARILLLVLAAIIVVWSLSTEDQRRRLLVAFGLVETLEQAEATALTLIGPGFAIELLPALPVGPMAYRFATPLPTGPAVPRPVAPPLAGRAVSHGDDPCAPGRAANPSRARPAARLWRYVDADGRTVFADQLPAGAEAQPLALAPGASSGVGGFSASYDYVGLTPPTGFQTQLEIDLAGVFRFLAEGLALGALRPVHLNLRIINGAGRFADATAATSLSGDDISGFYQYATNQAVVRWQGEAGTRAVARHEITHLALGNWLGRLPLWLNEGLAEFCERMQFQQNFAIAEAPAATLGPLQRLTNRGALPGLRRFMVAGRVDWQQWGNDLAYPYAWSLVHFLLQEPARARLLSYARVGGGLLVVVALVAGLGRCCAARGGTGMRRVYRPARRIGHQRGGAGGPGAQWWRGAGPGGAALASCTTVCLSCTRSPHSPPPGSGIGRKAEVGIKCRIMQDMPTYA